jgi:hypothetical protein
MRSPARTRTLLAAMAVGAALGGCSDIYSDRRETISLGANDAVEGNKVVHMVDPWPPQSGNRNLAFDGTRAQAAQERYRMNRVIQPTNVTTSSIAAQKQNQDAAQSAAAQSASAAAAVK